MVVRVVVLVFKIWNAYDESEVQIISPLAPAPVLDISCSMFASLNDSRRSCHSQCGFES